jgi:NADPH:quinone reductase-like Zn-dependent oxidoreductase
VAVKPRVLSFDQAAACGVPYTTAWEALDRAHVQAGTSLLVIGAGACGRAALGLARARRAEVVIAVRRAEQVAELRSQGIRAIRLEEGPNFVQSLQTEFPEKPEVAFDTTGLWLPLAVESLGLWGRAVVIAAPPDGHVNVPVLALYRGGGSIVGINSLLLDGKACARILGEIGRELDSGRLAVPSVPRAVPLSSALDAYRAIDKGSAEKVVLVPG